MLLKSMLEMNSNSTLICNFIYMAYTSLTEIGKYMYTSLTEIGKYMNVYII